MLEKKNSKKRTSCQALSISDTKIDGNIRTTSRDEPHLLFKEINENWCHYKKKKKDRDFPGNILEQAQIPFYISMFCNAI